LKAYFDSSALIAAFVEEEIHHESASEALVKTKAAFTSTHALAETFATLTGGRLTIQLTPEEALTVIETNAVGRLSVLELSTHDYRTAFRQSQSVGARGGAIYDLLHLQAARRGSATRIYTINVRHFQSFAPDLKEIISLP
jgi:predicted nucleic acid-binding protein